MPGPPPKPLTPDQFADRFRRAAPALWCVAAAVLGSRDGAEDTLQDAAIAAMQRLDAFVPGTDFQAWMSKIVRFTALNQARRTRRAPRSHADDLPELAAFRAVAPPLDAAGTLLAGQTEFDDEVMAALHSLHESERTCLLLRTVLEMSYVEIATMLEMPEGTAMSHVHRARRQLAARLSASRNTNSAERV